MHYNTKINVIRISLGADDLGGQNETPTTIHTDLPCRVNWSKGKEVVLHDKITHARDAKIYCRIVDITVLDRVVLDSKTYDIVSVNNVDNTNRQLVLEVKKVE